MSTERKPPAGRGRTASGAFRDEEPTPTEGLTSTDVQFLARRFHQVSGVLEEQIDDLGARITDTKKVLGERIQDVKEDLGGLKNDVNEVSTSLKALNGLAAKNADCDRKHDGLKSGQAPSPVSLSAPGWLQRLKDNAAALTAILVFLGVASALLLKLSHVIVAAETAIQAQTTDNKKRDRAFRVVYMPMPIAVNGKDAAVQPAPTPRPKGRRPPHR